MVLALSCAPPPPPGPITAECQVEVHNLTGGVLVMTAFGRDKMELGPVEPGAYATFTELCRVERVSVRGAPVDGGDPIWVTAIMREGKVVRVALPTR